MLISPIASDWLWRSTTPVVVVVDRVQVVHDPAAHEREGEVGADEVDLPPLHHPYEAVVGAVLLALYEVAEAPVHRVHVAEAEVEGDGQGSEQSVQVALDAASCERGRDEET